MPRIPQSVIDEILDRVQIEQVVGRRVKLTRAGRELKGLSPSGEKTASLFVSPHKKMFFNFSTGTNGNAITWLMEIEGMTFMEAIESLAADAGVKLPKDDSPQARAYARAYRESRDALDEAQEYFSECLARSKEARDYLDGRDIGARSIKAWGFGFAPDRYTGLLDHLLARKLDMAAIEASGLIIHGPDIERPHDRFRGRLMVPIRDARGKLVSFGGRVIGQGEPKWLNGPQTAIFDKSTVLFGLDRASEAIRKTGVAVIGEGYLDVIRPHQAGFKNIVAPMGTALQEHHLNALWRLAPLIVFCLDGDKAGQAATGRMMEGALPFVGADRRLAFAELPAGLDPDEVIAQGGRQALQSAVEAALPLDAMIWRVATKSAVSGPAATGEAIKRARELAGLIGDPDIKKAYLRDIERRGYEAGRTKAARVETPRPGSINPAEAAIMLGAALWPAYVEQHDETLGMLEVEAPLAIEVRDAVLAGTFEGERADRQIAVLRSQVPLPAPSFIGTEDMAGWVEALALRRKATQRRARRKITNGKGNEHG